MILIFFLCLKLSILHLCVCDHGYECSSDQKGDSSKIVIYLVQEDNSNVASAFQAKFNTVFRAYCEDYYEIHTGPLYLTDHNDNIVHFAVPDYYDGKPLNDYVYAGNISKHDNVNCTIKADKEKAATDCNEFANLVSKSVYKMNDGQLYNFVQSMDYRNETYVELTTTTSCKPFRQTSDLTVVILCLREQYFSEREVNLKDLKLIQVSDNDCPLYLEYTEDYLVDSFSPQYLPWHLYPEFEPQDLIPSSPWDDHYKSLGKKYNKYKNRLLAVLAPEPYEMVSHSLFPAIFYETPYMISDTKTNFPNSMNLVPWRLLKYGFLKFIQTVGWQRVAIVSDDSEYSVAFEDELTALFRKEKGIVHTVIRCEDANCKMDKIAQELNAAKARIIIANVKEENARILIRDTNHESTWLLRDMTGNIEVLAKNQHAFSFSLRINTKTKDCNDVEDNILTGLSGIAQAYENTKKYASTLMKREFYRNFFQELQRVTPNITEAEIVIKRTSKFKSKEISRMSVNTNGVIEVKEYKNPFPIHKPNDGTANCLVTSYDYYKPCQDHLVLLLMFILMLFVLTILVIICYFDKTSPFNNVRYQHF